MQTIKLMLAEIRYRKLNFILSLLAISIAVTLFVAGPVLVDGYAGQTRELIAATEKSTSEELAVLKDRTRSLMRDIGFNLMIMHRDTNMTDFWASDFAAADMPQEYLDRLADDRRLSMVRHLVATLQQKIEWQGRKVLLVGYLPEATRTHLRAKSPMGYNIKPGTTLLGHELAAGKKVGDTIEVLGRKFKIDRILPEQGSKEDITIALHLDDAQAVLNKPRRINQIMALGCRCAKSSLPDIREKLSDILPETRITEFRTRALARAEQRALVERKQKLILTEMAGSRAAVQSTLESLSLVTTPIVVIACAIWVGLLTLANVHQRRAEIGLLRALGKQSPQIATLFLAKSLLLGLLGAGIGFLLGSG
ncbi:MAG: FtsX-like permease family protein, partial [Planctomycetota bacterium]|nr:FtsX-like permease family protein [Planctomycetota bacterium]